VYREGEGHGYDRVSKESGGTEGISGDEEEEFKEEKESKNMGNSHK